MESCGRALGPGDALEGDCKTLASSSFSLLGGGGMSSFVLHVLPP